MPGTHNVRARLVRAAGELLVDGGVAAASPAAVAERAGASKMSIYRHFAGKGELVAAALADRERRHRTWLLRPPRGSGRFGSVLEMFDRVASAARAASFAGCPFVDACLEVRDPAHPVAEVAREHKAHIAEELGERLQNAGVARPRRLARTLLYLLDGATVHAVLSGDDAPLREAREAAERLIDLEFRDLEQGAGV
jgi:AcrR family transcriptional regulator